MAEFSSSEPQDELQCKLLALHIEHEKIEFIRKKGKNFIDDPELLSMKLGISNEQARGALEALESLETKRLSNEDISSIEKCLNDFPKIQSAKKIALFCELDEELVAKYLESKPLTDSQKDVINELFNTGRSIYDIAYQLKLAADKIQEYVDNKFLTFSGDEGQRILEIMQKQENLGTLNGLKLREMIKSRNLKLQDQLCCILPKKNEQEYEHILRYFKKFDESRNFFEIDMNLSIEDILFIRDNSLNIEQLSVRLNKVETVIREHSRQYFLNQSERDYYVFRQKKEIENIVIDFGKDTKTFHTYRTIITESFESLIESAEQVGLSSREAFKQLLPLIFYYLKCSLSFEDIIRIIAKTCKLTLTTYDIFHMIFQLSDPLVRGLCIEHYSFSNPVPFYYPRIQTKLLQEKEIELNLCTELWYSIQDYHGLVSFGLGRASWNPIGKSHLLDLIFETNFVDGNPQNSAFHLQSIDIQMSRNLFGEVNTNEEITKWAYIDCHRYSDTNIIKIICQHLDIALIHVSHLDYAENYLRITEEIRQLETYMLHLYVFIRDCGTEAIIQRRNDSQTFIFLPNLTKKDMTVYSTLKTIGYEILHLRSEKLIGTEFIESVMSELKSPHLKEIQTDKKIIQTIIEYIKEHPMSIRKIDFSFLSYYPSFVKYMSFYYQTALETDCNIITELNEKSMKLKECLEKSKIGDIALSFNDILESNYSGLILWKLSRELSALTDQALSRSTEVNNERYSVEIFWREALLSSKYGNNLKCKKSRESYAKRFACNFSNHVERGEAFELIDGDNLRFFNKDINALLSQLYKKQRKRVCKQAPIVVSIFGPQSSGKSTLLNYCFGCKFLTSAGRCTKGVYGSLAKLSQSINHTNQFLILDTEGLDGGSKRGPSLIHFDRTMVLFCLAVSQVIIINIKGELGEEMQNMLQICAYSLNKLRVSKVVAPKIYFVLNQQADPDPSKHLDAMNNLLEKLNEESDLMELEGTKISDLIQVSRENLFILPSAFNTVQINKPAAQLFSSNVIKLSPTIAFANKCAELRQSIMNQLIDMPLDERATFNSMNKWLEMSGVIWETIIRYQDIVKYKNMDELKSCNLLTTIVSDLMKKHINCHHIEFDSITEQLICEIKELNKLQPPNVILEEEMLIFDEVFEIYHEQCLIEFNQICQNDELLKRMTHVCEEMKSNLARLIYIERKNYKDVLKFQIKAVLTDIKLSENMGKFQERISQNIDVYLDKNEKEQTRTFEEIWEECFGDNERKEDENERDEDFNNLYTIFKMESKTMENKRTIHDLIRESNFDMDKMIELLRSGIQETFERDSSSSTAEDFIYPCMQNNIPIKEMAPFIGEVDYEYLGKDTLYTIDECLLDSLYPTAVIPQIREWVPECCHSLVDYCSGYYNHADITWEMEERKQILLLASLLREPNDIEGSTWKKLINNISSRVHEIIETDPEISQGTVKQLVNYLCSTIKHVNYEINYIQARLTIAAERTLTTLVFVYAFKSKWGLKTNISIQSKISNEEEKRRKLEYFLGTIEKSKMSRGNWDRKKMRLNDRKTSSLFASDFLEAVKREVITDEHTKIEQKFRDSKERLSYKSILLQIEDLITKELEIQPGEEVLDQNNLVIQFICNRNEIINREFHRKWEELVEVLYGEIFKNLNTVFTDRLRLIQAIFLSMLQNLAKRNAESTLAREIKFDSDSIFMIDDKLNVSAEREKECLLKSPVIYLQKYLDPDVPQKQLQTFLNSSFKIDGIKMKKKKDDSILCDKPKDPCLILDNGTFKKLTNTRMFSSEQIFNIHQYIEEFISTLQKYQFELSRAKLEEIIEPLREEYSSLVINCPSHCPSCGKLCDRELHPYGGRCQIRTGHQICSMGGKVWKNDEERTAILFMCDDYEEYTQVQMSGQKMNWKKFKEVTANEWDWAPPNDREYIMLLENNREKMKKIWDKFGRGILNYHAAKGVNIKYITYSASEEGFLKYNPYLLLKKSFEISEFVDYYICFVIADTESKKSAVERNTNFVSDLMNSYQQYGKSATFKIVMYDGHREGKKVIEQLPTDGNFTMNRSIIERMVKKIKIQDGEDGSKSVLEGLATATTKSKWKFSKGVKNIIIHLFDAPPHGVFPYFISHRCNVNWRKDVWEKMHKFNISYSAISRGNQFTGFKYIMRTNLGELCNNYYWAKKDDGRSNLSIFIDYEAH